MSHFVITTSNLNVLVIFDKFLCRFPSLPKICEAWEGEFFFCLCIPYEVSGTLNNISLLHIKHWNVWTCMQCDSLTPSEQVLSFKDLQKCEFLESLILLVQTCWTLLTYLLTLLGYLTLYILRTLAVFSVVNWTEVAFRKKKKEKRLAN